jgi:hypothetical protein
MSALRDKSEQQGFVLFGHVSMTVFGGVVRCNDVAHWPFATFRFRAAICSFSERSRHQLGQAKEPEFMSDFILDTTRPPAAAHRTLSTSLPLKWRPWPDVRFRG